MTARLSLVIEIPQNIFSASLFPFSFLNRPSGVKKPVWLAKYWNLESAGQESEDAVDRFGGKWKRKRSRCGGSGERSLEGEGEAMDGSLLSLSSSHSRSSMFEDDDMCNTQVWINQAGDLLSFRQTKTDDVLFPF
ncbi:hypothetical protein NL676_010549 [Syzygium grande]|nr:hypothetical protein NL676_010549 [Syzygium grande]